MPLLKYLCTFHRYISKVITSESIKYFSRYLKKYLNFESEMLILFHKTLVGVFRKMRLKIVTMATSWFPDLPDIEGVLSNYGILL